MVKQQDAILEVRSNTQLIGKHGPQASMWDRIICLGQVNETKGHRTTARRRTLQYVRHQELVILNPVAAAEPSLLTRTPGVGLCCSVKAAQEGEGE